VVRVFGQGGKLYLLGNGGSAAQAQHVATELVVRFKQHRRALPAVALNTDTAIITAAANDFDYTQVFARQVDALLTTDDLLVVFSTSGASPNVLEAVRAGRKKQVTTVGFTGSAGGQLCELVDVAVAVPTTDTQRIQEAHLLLWHIICELVDNAVAERNQEVN
jgi:D-sedoheptulose 7-phosphate isomerase